MRSSLYVSLSGELALERRLETIANNVANMNTVGFRAQGVTFQAELARTGDNFTDFAAPGAKFISRRAGPLVRTGNPLDVAVQGNGWFAIKTPNGIAYTRDGRMTVSDTGSLESLNGYPILDAGGAPIVVDPTAGPITIAQDGMITQNGRQSSAIGLFDIPEAASLTRTVNSGVIPDKPATPILDFSKNGVLQGFVEQSNVNPVLEMTKLVNLTRDFDNISAQMTKSESTIQDAIKTLGGSAA